MSKLLDSAFIIQQLNWRYATKIFDSSRAISEKDWETLEETLTLTPSSFGIQPWKFIVVTDPALRQELQPLAWRQPQIVDASHLVVFAARTVIDETYIDRYLEEIATMRSIPADNLTGFRNMLKGVLLDRMNDSQRTIWATRQVYIALGNFLNAAAMLGIDACPMEGFENEAFDKVLRLDRENLTSVVLATAGYRADNDAAATFKKVRFPKAQLFSHI